MAVWKPKTSKYYYCRFKIGVLSFSGSTNKTSKAEAKAYEKEWKKNEARKLDAAGGSKALGVGMTFLAAADRYMSECKMSHKEMAAMERKMDWLVAHIGVNTPLADIDDEMIAKLVSIRGKDHRFGMLDKEKVGNGSINADIVTPLSSILNKARGWKVALPWKPDFKLHRLEVTARERELALIEEFRLQEQAGDYWDIFEFALLSGLRREELLIEWKDVRWENDRIRVITKGKKLHEVVITPGIRRILEANLGRHDEAVFTVRREQVVIGPGLPERKPDRKGRPIKYEGIYAAFKRICKMANITDLTIHDLRRTAGARKYRLTGDIALVSTFLNHANIAMTRKHYVHIKLNDISDRIISGENEFQFIKDAMRAKWAA